MILAHARVADFDTFRQVFTTRGAEHRAKFGSKHSQIFRGSDDPNDVWVLFNWDRAGYEKFLADDTTKQIMAEAGLQGPPEPVYLDEAGEVDA